MINDVNYSLNGYAFLCMLKYLNSYKYFNNYSFIKYNAYIILLNKNIDDDFSLLYDSIFYDYENFY